MAVPSLATLLGLGYSGYAEINGIFVPLLPSQVEEQENLYRTQGAVSALVQDSTGEIPLRQRRQLTFHLTTELCGATLSLIYPLCLSFRASGLITTFASLKVVSASQEGYESIEAYVEDITLTVPREGMPTITFAGFTHVWTPTVGMPAQQTSSAFNPFNQTQYQPIPSWDTVVDHTGLGSTVCTEWGLTFKNNFNFKHLLEATPLPPTPRIMTPGPLFTTLATVSLAPPNTPPAESGAAVVTVGGGLVGTTSCPVYTFTLPLLYRDPHRRYENIGSQDGVIEWGTSWFSLGLLPTIR